jgi:hypothetical protein
MTVFALPAGYICIDSTSEHGLELPIVAYDSNEHLDAVLILQSGVFKWVGKDRFDERYEVGWVGVGEE